jgi:hypothetical protein
MKVEDCEGCIDNKIEGCIWFEKSLTCPCSICLIKIMCLVPCDLLKKHIDEVYKLRGGLNYNY